MSDLVTTATLRDRVRKDTGFDGDAYASDADITDLILRSARALHDELIGNGQEYYRSRFASTTIPGTATYALPADFYRALQVVFQGSGGLWTRAVPYEHYETADMLNATVNGNVQDLGQYRLGGSYGINPTEVIEWSPTPQIARAFAVYYLPSATFIISGGEYGIRSGGPGWEEYIVADVAAKLLEREEGDPGPWLRRKAEVLDRIKRLAPSRDMGNPVRPTRSADPYGVTRPYRPWDRYGYGRRF